MIELSAGIWQRALGTINGPLAFQKLPTDLDYLLFAVVSHGYRRVIVPVSPCEAASRVTDAKTFDGKVATDDLDVND